MKRAWIVLFILPALLITSCREKGHKPAVLPERVTIPVEVLKDKIKGGWAGQTIGCTFGGPTEFRFKGTMTRIISQWCGTMITLKRSSNPIPVIRRCLHGPDLLEVIERLGIHAPADSSLSPLPMMIISSGMPTRSPVTISLTASCLLLQATGRTIPMLMISISRLKPISPE
jgi:hypothetical protein